MPRKTTTAKKTIKKVSTKRKTRGRPKKVESLNFADGKIEDQHKLATDIEDILNTTPDNPFGTTSIAAFDEKMTGMTITQMQELAVKASIFPSGNKTTLKNRLRKEFSAKYETKGGKPRHTAQVEAPVVDPDSQLAKDILDILNSK